MVLVNLGHLRNNGVYLSTKLVNAGLWDDRGWTSSCNVSGIC